MLRHVQGDLDGQRARVLRGEDGCDHAGDYGDQRQVDLVQRTGWVTLRERDRDRQTDRQTEKMMKVNS